MAELRVGLFPALLKHWRGQRGLSQLDLALAADVSARHVSFLETGRSVPSADMVVRLGAALGVPLRHVDAMLRAAGHDARYGNENEPLPPVVADALGRLKEHHEPFPFMVIDRIYRLLDLNRGARAMLSALLGPTLPLDGDPSTIAGLGLNLAQLTFDPNGAHSVIVNFDDVGRHLLWRIQREVLHDPDDRDARDLLDRLLAMPTVSPDWREADLSIPSEPVLVFHLRRGDLELRFLTMVTVFQAPQSVALDELRVETWLPYDAVTADICRALAAGDADLGLG